jgi:uncharacterized SAM-binding protein YcdF (DUF218 family)
MFYYASKIIWFFVTPSTLLVSLILLGLLLALFRSMRKVGIGIALTFTIATIAFGRLPLAAYIIVPLESRFLPFLDDGQPVEGIILLGGAVDARISVKRGAITLNEAGERILGTVQLATRYPNARILLSSGSTNENGVTEASVIASFLKDFGIDSARIMVEEGSRTTYENAVFSRQVAAPKAGERWLLVTSAWHMPRAVGVFEKAGFPVVPYPVDFSTAGGFKDQAPFVSISDGLRNLDFGTKEWIGLFAYYLTGRSAVLLPGSQEPPGWRRRQPIGDAPEQLD